MICIYCGRPIKLKTIVWVDGPEGVRFAYGYNCAKKLGLLPQGDAKAQKAAEMKVSVAFHTGGSNADILNALADRADAMGDAEGAAEYRLRANEAAK